MIQGMTHFTAPYFIYRNKSKYEIHTRKKKKSKTASFHYALPNTQFRDCPSKITSLCCHLEVKTVW